MAKFLGKMGAFRRKETTERMDGTAALAEQGGRTETASPWDILTKKGKEGATKWGDLIKVKFAGDGSTEVVNEVAESEMEDAAGMDEVEVAEETQPTAEQIVDFSREDDSVNEQGVKTEFGNHPEGVGTRIERAAEQEPNETLTALKNFFRSNMAIKDEIFRLAPKGTDLYGEESRSEYGDKLFKEYRNTEWRFEKINKDFHLISPEVIKKFFDRGVEDLAAGQTDPGALRELYQRNVSMLREDFLEKVRQDCLGYGPFNPGMVLRDARSVNELLHACHSAIMNNERILRKVPALATKRIKREEEVTLRGEENEIGRSIFEAIPDDLDAGTVDIVAVDGRAIAMVRCRGHALVVQAEAFESGSEKVLVNYNIPKIINRGMVEQLPGIDKITEMGAKGRFLCKADQVGERVATFIGMVPTDADFADD